MTPRSPFTRLYFVFTLFYSGITPAILGRPKTVPMAPRLITRSFSKTSHVTHPRALVCSVKLPSVWWFTFFSFPGQAVRAPQGQEREAGAGQAGAGEITTSGRLLVRDEPIFRQFFSFGVPGSREGGASGGGGASSSLGMGWAHLVGWEEGMVTVVPCPRMWLQLRSCRVSSRGCHNSSSRISSCIFKSRWSCSDSGNFMADMRPRL